MLQDFLYLIYAGVQKSKTAYKTNRKLSTFTNKANVQKKISEVRKRNRVEADQIYHSAETNSNMQFIFEVGTITAFLSATRIQ